MFENGYERITRVQVQAAGRSERTQFDQHGLPVEFSERINLNAPASCVVTRELHKYCTWDRRPGIDAQTSAPRAPIKVFVPEIKAAMLLTDDDATMLAHALLGAAAKAGG